jgi:hypothetical protein
MAIGDHIVEPNKLILTEEQRAALELVCDCANNIEYKYAEIEHQVSQ